MYQLENPTHFPVLWMFGLVTKIRPKLETAHRMDNYWKSIFSLFSRAMNESSCDRNSTRFTQGRYRLISSFENTLKFHKTMRSLQLFNCTAQAVYALLS